MAEIQKLYTVRKDEMKKLFEMDYAIVFDITIINTLLN